MNKPEVYRKATTRAVQRIRHLWWQDGPDAGKALCGTRPHEYDPAPSRFLPGDFKPDVVEVPCPICAAVAVVYEAELAMRRREQDA
ncbi:hypothetical protein PG1550B_0368 [Bifidobacterium pseudolongum subsp. globosum]|uniref:hypothetical protein n=1 Tax=Bifidobacterium pseudolongum TaxID=1694 RepID=UPI00101F05C8|nr:hypothetical protein [Bifidobacterium pseudolongum]RYQ59297.1 hypothetical protein PG1550B_0368 [Bifidobacterium pseudolongum subsp. globosum]